MGDHDSYSDKFEFRIFDQGVIDYFG